MWTLDPIDGTKGFLRGEQYAVCLALIVDSQVEVGVIGCPNLPHDLNGNLEDKGVLFVAIKGQGVEQVCPLPLVVQNRDGHSERHTRGH
jgi:3'(2'), 5'-bisphosphate nucleotidase